MKLNALIGENRFITAPGRPDAPLFLPSIEGGNVLPVELRAWKKSMDGPLVAEDLSDHEISLQLGTSNQSPELGFWQVTVVPGFHVTTSPAIAARASSAEVATALAFVFGPVMVEGGNGSYIVTLTNLGVQPNAIGEFQGNTDSDVYVHEINPGTTTTPAQYRIEVLESAPAQITDWTDGETTPENSFTNVSGKLWRLILDPNVDNGFFTLTIDAVTTGFVSFNGGAYAIARALAVADKAADVTPDGTGGYWVNFEDTVTVATVGGELVILPFSQGDLDLTGAGVRELLDGLQFAAVKLVVILAKAGHIETVATADIMLTMPVVWPLP